MTVEHDGNTTVGQFSERFRLFIKKHSLECRAATRLISASREQEPPFFKRLLLRLHLSACKACVRFQQQVKFLREIIRNYDPSASQGAMSTISLSTVARWTNQTHSATEKPAAQPVNFL
jgi:hypothetical protein